MVCSLKQPFKAAAPHWAGAGGGGLWAGSRERGLPSPGPGWWGGSLSSETHSFHRGSLRRGGLLSPLGTTAQQLPWSWGRRQSQEDWAHTDHSHLLLSFSAAPALLPSQIPSPALTTPGGRNHHYLSDRQVPNAPRHTLTQGHGGEAVLHLAPHPSSSAGCCLTGEPRPGCRCLLLRSASRDPAKLVASRAGPGASTL